MKMMAIDFGDARTGVAVCDPLEMLASPFKVIKQKDMAKLVEEIALLASEQNVEKIVVGYPKNMNGSNGERAAKTETLVNKLKLATNLDVVLWDERNTTVLAHKILKDNEVFGKKRKNIVDAVAAVLILENYIKFKKSREREVIE
ncbi:MAG: Holliday junction resolvase RuvX [Oscillospiraceae bacterium]|nr:Holliday junction resolvase RuvX [Oscillospiraceae bacterium]